jgi:hypothetical protein
LFNLDFRWRVESRQRQVLVPTCRSTVRYSSSRGGATITVWLPKEVRRAAPCW